MHQRPAPTERPLVAVGVEEVWDLGEALELVAVASSKATRVRTRAGRLAFIPMIARAGRGQEEDGQVVAPTGRLAASSVLAPATNSDQWPPVAKHTAAKRSRSALALAAFEVL